MKRNSTAILFFSRTAEEEAKHKSFVSNGAKLLDIRIAQQLINQNLSEANRTKLPVITVFSDQQVGSDFGARFSNAILDVFDQGYENVITIGNDCLSVTKQTILEVERQLERGAGLVAGPTIDGGAYILGFSRENFEVDRFKALSWCTSNLFQEILDYANDLNVSIQVLETFRDIDSSNDLAQLLQGSSIFISAIRSIIFSYIQEWSNVVNRFMIQQLVSNRLFRGPPVTL